LLNKGESKSKGTCSTAQMNKITIRICAVGAKDMGG